MDVVFAFMSYRQMVRSELVQAKAMIASIEWQVKSAPILSVDTIRNVSELTSLTSLGVVLLNSQKKLVYQSRVNVQVADKLATFAILNISTDKLEKQFYGGSFGLLGIHYDHLFLVKSLRSPQGLSLGAVGVDVDLSSFAQLVWHEQRLVWAYTFFNLVILGGLAYWRFSHFLIMPLQQIARKAASYQDDDFYLTPDFRSDDVATLSHSLDQMFRRIHNDRNELQEMVTALEEVNESLTKAQADIIRGEKLASVGRLSAGIAHEIGNPLGIVLGYLELLKGEGLSEEERLDFTTRAMSEIQRINTIIRQLLDLARPADDDCGKISVHAVLERFRDDLALKTVVGDMQLDFDLTAERDVVEIDSEKLRQVFLNLLLNGADAVKDGTASGKMKISTTLLAQGEGRDSALEILFADNGPGIDPAHMKQIFDPFFSTKEVGEGTGLGLSVSYMIIDSGGGSIQALSNKEGAGTAFQIILPLVK